MLDRLLRRQYWLIQNDRFNCLFEHSGRGAGRCEVMRAGSWFCISYLSFAVQNFLVSLCPLQAGSVSST